MGNAGAAIFFVLLLAASIGVGVCVLAYAARCVLVAVEATASGQDKIIWPNEPFTDWLGHAVQFIELLGIWLAPAAIAARLLRHTWLPDDGALRVLLLAGPGLWLFFPIGLLSSLSAESRWMPFRWTILVRFLRVAPSAVVFYFLTALLLLVAAVPWYYTLFGGNFSLLPVAAAAGGIVLFLYGRLLGRLAWLIQRLPATERVPAKAKTTKRSPAVKPRTKKKRQPRADASDAWEEREEEASRKKSKRFPWAEEPPPAQPKPGLHIPSAYEIEGYGFAADKPTEPPPPLSASFPHPQDEEKGGSRYAITPEKNEPPDRRRTSVPSDPQPRELQSEIFAEQVRHRIAERRRVQPVLPAHPFLSGVYTFPLYPACLPNVLALSLAFLAVGTLVHFLMEFGHMLFGW